MKIANGEINDYNTDEGVTIDMTAPVEIDLEDDPKEEANSNNNDNLSFEQYETEDSNNEDESYSNVDDLLDDIDEGEEMNNEEELEIIDDLPVDDEVINEEPTDEFIDNNDEVKNLMKDPTVQTVFTDTKEEIEEHFADVHKKEEPEDIGEVDSEPDN